MWILSFFMKLPEKAKKIETLLRFQRWMKKTNILWARFNSMQKLKQLSPKARKHNTNLSTNRKVQTQTRRRLLIWTLFSATLKLMVWKMGKLKAYLCPNLTTFLSKFAWTHGGKTEKNDWTGDSLQFSAQYKLTAILRRYIHLTYPRTMGSKNPEKSLQRSESHLSWHERGKGNKPQAA